MDKDTIDALTSLYNSNIRGFTIGLIVGTTVGVTAYLAGINARNPGLNVVGAVGMATGLELSVDAYQIAQSHPNLVDDPGAILGIAIGYKSVSLLERVIDRFPYSLE